MAARPSPQAVIDFIFEFTPDISPCDRFGLAPGDYVVEYCWWDYETSGPRCHTEPITIP